MGHRGGQKFGETAQCFAISRIETHNFCARAIDSVLLIIIITDFSLTVLGLKILKLNDESYVICEAKVPVLNVGERRLISNDKTAIAYSYLKY
jgi:hypothetical protein